MKQAYIFFLAASMFLIAGISIFVTFSSPGHLDSAVGQTLLVTPPSLNLSRVSESATLTSEPYALTILPVTQHIGNRSLPSWGYNGQIPGPLLTVRKGSNHTIVVTNTMPYETTVHWHGLRLENQFDGVPDVTQKPIGPNETFTYQLTFPDAGIFWYHPHIREDYQQEAGLYGMIHVIDETSPHYYPVVLDDIALDANGTVPFYEEVITHAVMGRYGNQYVINGREAYILNVTDSKPIYLAFLNVANVRPFRITIPGAKMTHIEGDLGSLEHEQVIDSFVLAPAERVVVRVEFPAAGTYTLYNDNPLKQTALGTLVVTNPTQLSPNEERTTSGLSALVQPYRSSPPNHTLNLGLDLPNMGHMGAMHVEDRIEWEDTMPMMASITNESVRWTITDAVTKKQNMALQYLWPLGSYQKIRLVNSLESPHPMQHPIHFHGQRFLVLSTNGIPTNSLGWKDTVLVGMGDTVDILLEVSNPGEWMIHCHIAEHLQSGMMSSFIAGDIPAGKNTHAN